MKSESFKVTSGHLRSFKVTDGQNNYWSPKRVDWFKKMDGPSDGHHPGWWLLKKFKNSRIKILNFYVSFDVISHNFRYRLKFSSYIFISSYPKQLWYFKNSFNWDSVIRVEMNISPENWFQVSRFISSAW